MSLQMALPWAWAWCRWSRQVAIENDLEIYLFEAFSAMELDTWEWNTFRTH
jgi:hypothetical protein